MQRFCKGILIVIEGIDGAGKTTQISLLRDFLVAQNYDVQCLREPTDGPWGQKIRRLMQTGRDSVPPERELEWFLKDRQENVCSFLQPALQRGQIVLLDRYYFSTIAYQGALGLDPQSIQSRNEAFAPPPDLLILLELSPHIGWQRARQRGALNHFERLDYLTRVATLFAQMQFAFLQRIPADRPVAVVQQDIRSAVQQYLQQRPLCASKTSGESARP